MDEMTAHASITGDKELMSKFKALSDAVAGEALAKAATAGALPIQNAAKEKAPAKTRTLSRSIHTEVTESDREHATVEVGTDLIYAAIQEFGGTITAKNAAHLAIPVTDQAASYPPRSFPGKLHVQSYGGMVSMLVDEQGVTQYALKSSVTLHAQPYLRPALDENRARFETDAGIALKQILASVTPGVE
jgi:HK97 gp10 family phage protein